MKINLKINGKEVSGCAGQSLVQVAKENGIDIPTLCHDERVKAYGACGICFVEAENNPRLLRACATNIADGMSILTESPRVTMSRRFALELLLSDHQGDCRPPCMLACPGKTDCQGYVGLIANGKFKEASAMVKDVIPLPASIGRICPHPCEDACRRELVEEPISIAALKSVVGDYDLINGEAYMPPIETDTHKSVVVIGGGPGGLTAAYQLRRRGHRVKVLDAMPHMGGMLRYGIPEYRLPKALLDKEIELFKQMEIELVNNVRVGKDISLEALRAEYDAVVVAIGAWKSTGMSCPGDDLADVLGGIYFLGDVALGKAIDLGEKVAVVGGGNTAMDACRTAMRMGASEVYVVYRRTRDEMPAEEIEIKEAEEEGIIFKYLTNPLEIIGNEQGRVCNVRLQKMELGAPDASGRRSPVPIAGAEEMLAVDTVIMAIGQGTNNEGFEALDVTRWKTIIADEKTFATNLEGVFAVGDATNNGASIAIEAIAEARDASEAIHEFLMTGKIPEIHKPYYVTDEKTADDFADKEKIAREQMDHVDPLIRRRNFAVITDGLSLEQAKKEASRCLECGCADVYECKLLDYANKYKVNPDKYEAEKNSISLDLSNPFFYRNMNKCILCGLCVRVCDEVMGRTALGFSGRGFDTVAISAPSTEPKPSMESETSIEPKPFSPQFDTTIINSDCISCGQCVLLCPTGAISERLLIEKAVPLNERVTSSTCPSCSVGCKVSFTSSAGMLLRSLPTREDNESLLCSKGRFDILKNRKAERIITPLLRSGNELKPCSYEEAYAFIAEKLAVLRNDNAVAIALSDEKTNEEVLAIKSLADKLGTNRLFSLNGLHSGLAEVTGLDASTCNFDDLMKTKLILMVCPDIMDSHPIAGIKVKQAVENGVKLILVSDKETQADEWASEKFAVNDLAKATEIYEKAESAIIIFDQKGVSTDNAKKLAKMAVNSSNSDKILRGVIQLKPGCNSQGLVNLGVNIEAGHLISEIEEKNVRVLFIFGEDTPKLDLSGFHLLVVHDTTLTDTARKADVVLPACDFAEINGTYVNTVGEKGEVKAAISSIVKDNCKTISELTETIKTSSI